MCFIMFLISVGHFLGFSVPRDITNFVHYETEKQDLFNSCQKQLVTCFMMTSMSVIFCKL